MISGQWVGSGQSSVARISKQWSVDSDRAVTGQTGDEITDY